MWCPVSFLKAKKKNSKEEKILAFNIFQCDKNYLSYKKILLQICEPKQQHNHLRNGNKDKHRNQQQ